MKNWLASVMLGVITLILFLGLFFLSDSQQWPKGITIGLTVILLIIVNASFTWLFWQSRKQHLNEEEDN
ncbi:hypothetical protein [Leuconostoc inhae]|uniref:hypothetical protein n=1 Tax=Leuconostoc inhae TaxID=178001 RepID=UPI001C7CEAC4|nr:hypothetical protein [Leuconostoc inhae]